MKRMLMSIGVALVVLLTSFSLTAQEPLAPSEGPYLPVVLLNLGASTPDAGAKEGDPCRTINWIPNMPWTEMPYQIVIRDETDRMISVTTVETQWEKFGEREELGCPFESFIALPDAEFYTVFIGEQRLITFTQDSLPTDDGLFIAIGTLGD